MSKDKGFFEQPRNAPSSIVDTLIGISTLVRDLQPAKAFFAMEVTVTGITIAVKELHPSKVLLLILSMLPPIVTDVKDLHPKNAELPYDCNNYYMRAVEVMIVPMAVIALPSVIDTTGVSKKAEAPYDYKVIYYDIGNKK